MTTQTNRYRYIETYRTKDELGYIAAILHSVNGLKGDVVEIGVYNGGSARYIREHSTGDLHLFDTFTGIIGDQILKNDGEFKDGEYKCVLPEVQEVLSEYNDVHYYEGDVADMKDAVKKKKFKFVHIDVDIYLPLSRVIEFFYERLVKGGVMVISNYDDKHPGVVRAVDEFNNNHDNYSRLVRYEKDN